MARKMTVENGEVGIGDYVCFKAGTEQCAKVTLVRWGTGELVVQAPADGFEGYIKHAGTHVVDADRCWVE